MTVLNGSLGKVSTSSHQIHQLRTSSPNLLLSLQQTPNLRQLIVDTSLCPHNPATAIDCQPCNRSQCKTCPSHHLGNSFTSSGTSLAYSIIIHVDCKSMNLMYQLECTDCIAFYIGETRCSLSDHMNGHRFTTRVSNPGLPVTIHTHFHQIPFQDCWSVSSSIHRLPDSTLTTFAVNWKLHTTCPSFSFRHYIS